MHPRSESRVPADDINQEWPARQKKQAELLLKFVQERGSVHPREVDEHFAHGTVKNYWGGSSTPRLTCSTPCIIAACCE